MELSATIPALLRQQVATYGSETILRKKEHGIWNAVTWSDLDARVSQIGRGLRAAGIASGEAVAIVSETRPEFVYADLAILGCGAVSVAIHPDDDGDRVGGILRDTGAVCVIVEGEEQLDKVLGVRADCPKLRLTIILDMKGLREFQDPGCVGLADLVKGDNAGTDWGTASAAVAPDQIAAILIDRTGGGRPITHAEIMRSIDTAAETLLVHAGDERLVVLPMSDPTERVLGLYLALRRRVVSNYLENPETATENLREVRPTVFGADAEAWERLHGRIDALAANATSVQRMLYRWAMSVGDGGGLAAMVANYLVLPAVRTHLGFGRLRVAYVGDRVVPEDVGQWARALGITVRYYNPFQKGETHA